MLFAKWLLVTFVGITTFLARDVRAEGYGRDVEGKLTPTMRRNIEEAFHNFGLNINVDSYVLRKRPAQIEQGLALANSESFSKTIARISESCGVTIRAIEVSDRNLLVSDVLRVNLRNRSTVVRLESLPEQCEQALTLLGRIKAAIAPAVVSFDIVDLISERVTLGQLQAWAAAFEQHRFPLLAEGLALECRSPVVAVHLTFYNSYSRSAQALSLRLSDSPDQRLVSLQRLLAPCSKFVPALSAFNTEIGLRHGVALTFELDDIWRRAVLPSQLSAWLKWLNADPTRLDVLRQRLVGTTGSRHFRRLRQCIASRGSLGACSEFVVVVRMGVFTGVDDPVVSAFFALLLGDVVTSGVIIATGAVESTRAELDVTRAPGIPSSFK